MMNHNRTSSPPSNTPMARVIVIISTVLRLLIGVILIVSSAPKIQYPYEFLSIVYRYELVGAKAGVIVAVLLPWMEFVTGFCMIVGILQTAALTTATALFAIFVLAMGHAMRQHLTIACGCFDVHAETIISSTTVMRTAGLLIAAALLLALHIYRQRQASLVSAATTR